MPTEKRQTISTHIPLLKSKGYTIKEVPTCFVRPWITYVNQILKQPSVDKRPDFLIESESSIVGVPNLTVKSGEIVWEITRNYPEAKVFKRKVSIRKSIGAPNVEAIELIESDFVNDSTASRRLLVKFDSLGEGVSSITDERVIISPQDTPVNDKNIDLKRIVYNWDLSTQKPSIAFSEEIEISDFELSQFPKDGLLEDIELQRILKKPNHFIPLSDDLKSPNNWLVNNIPPDYSIFPSATVR